MSDEPRILGTREGYDLWASTYDTMGNWLLALEEPEVDRAVGPVTGMDLLDVGAGTGRHAIRLAARGARVTAIDFSEEMLAKARAKPGAECVRFLMHDVAHPLPFADRSFDRVLSALVLEHIQVAALPAFFAELGRVTRHDGRIVVTAMHPAMFVKGISANFRDEDGVQVRPRSYAATVSDYVMGALHAGLNIVALSEHRVDEPLAERFPRALKLLSWPALFVMSLSPRVSSDATNPRPVNP
ncbi:MAG TPA: class I SAM-dependent methyltransferase [Candidatus Limnocylindria bacterium]|nr:class I SAM-dependent methyltransferase [Candidatus Limnocylindria bacterium]